MKITRVLGLVALSLFLLGSAPVLANSSDPAQIKAEIQQITAKMKAQKEKIDADKLQLMQLKIKIDGQTKQLQADRVRAKGLRDHLKTLLPPRPEKKGAAPKAE